MNQRVVAAMHADLGHDLRACRWDQGRVLHQD